MMDQDSRQPPVLQTREEATDMKSVEPIVPPAQQFSPPQKKGSKKALYIFGVALLIILAALGGWYYGTSQQKATSDAEKVELNSKITSLEKENSALKTKAAKTVATTVDANTGYMVIKEWDIRLKATDPSLSYSLAKDSAGTTFAGLNTTETKKVALQCMTDMTNPALVSIGRYDHKLSDSESAGLGFLKQIGTYYYYVAQANGGCAANPTGYTTSITTLNTAAKTIEAAQ